MAGLMLASIARPTDNVNMAGPTKNYSRDRVVYSACPAIPHPPKPPVLGRTLTERSLTAALFFLGDPACDLSHTDDTRQAHILFAVLGR
jgi:hypothetical protein